MMNYIFKTKRLKFRKIEANDAHKIYDVAKDLIVSVNINWNKKDELEPTIKKFRELNKKGKTFVVINKINNQIIGSMGNFPKEHNGKQINSFNFIIGFLFRHQGFAKEILEFTENYFKNQNIKKLWFITSSANIGIQCFINHNGYQLVENKTLFSKVYNKKFNYNFFIKYL